MEATLASAAADAGEAFTVRELVEQPQIQALEVAPSGQWITFLWTRDDASSNLFRARLTLLNTAAGATGRTLSEVAADPGLAINGDGSFESIGAESRWSPREDCVAYTRRAGSVTELVMLWPDDGREVSVASGSELKILRWSSDGEQLFYAIGSESKVKPDTAIRVQDDDGFHAPRWLVAENRTVKWAPRRHAVASGASFEISDSDVPVEDFASFTEEVERRLPSGPNDRVRVAEVKVMPGGNQIAFLGHAFRDIGDEAHATREYFIGSTTRAGDESPTVHYRSSHYPVLLGWNRNRNAILAALRDSESTTIAAIASSTGRLRPVTVLSGVTYPEAMNARRNFLFAVQHPHLAPDQIVKIDLQTGEKTVLAQASPGFEDKDLPRTQLIPIAQVRGNQWGVLVYPNDYVAGQRYPLVFTTYRAYSVNLLGGSVGGEFPVLPWAANGIAVFCLDTGTVNMPGRKGDMISDGVWRAKLPIEAMRAVVSRLDSEGIVDPHRVGVTGLSYGSEIVDYALAHSDFFRAAAAGGAGFSDPLTRWLLPRTRDAEWDERGRVEPDPASWAAWSMISPALNAANARTPILNNTAGEEALFSVMLWKAYREAGVPIEWYVFPGEGHIKVYPRNVETVMTLNLDWMRFWLKDEEDPAPEKADQYARWREMRNALQARTAQ